MPIGNSNLSNEDSDRLHFFASFRVLPITHVGGEEGTCLLYAQHTINSNFCTINT